jgi:hypothetical protein
MATLPCQKVKLQNKLISDQNEQLKIKESEILSLKEANKSLLNPPIIDNINSDNLNARIDQARNYWQNRNI